MKLEIAVEPADVRLITNGNDAYSWQVLSEKECLFREHLSKHPTVAYRELYREFGMSLEAILAY